MRFNPTPRAVVLAGGVGGARFAAGLVQVLPPEQVTIVVNVGDDFTHFGLHISPDLDTVCYTLAGRENPVTGWGRADDTWHALEAIAELGGPTWFRLGDRDLGLHLERTRRLQAGQPLSAITRAVCQAWGVRATVLPVTDDPVPTVVHTAEHGTLEFQEYFVRRHCQPRVQGFEFVGAAQARAAPGVLEAIAAAEAVLIAPSNPWVSIDPILAIPGVREALTGQTVVAVSPLIGGRAVKGPAAKMFAELGIEPSALAVARHYQGLIQGLVIDESDAALAPRITAATGQAVFITDAWMPTPARRRALAQSTWDFAQALRLHASLG